MKTLNQQLGELVRECRKANGITQRELANSVGMTQANISHMERGKFNTATDSYVKCMNVMGEELTINIK